MKVMEIFYMRQLFDNKKIKLKVLKTSDDVWLFIWTKIYLRLDCTRVREFRQSFN